MASATAQPSTEPSLKPQRVTKTAAPKVVTYRVKRGDTLFAIAQLFDTTVAKIKTLNQLRSNRITPGTRLKIAAD
jgi:LysM repeat protein